MTINVLNCRRKEITVGPDKGIRRDIHKVQMEGRIRDRRLLTG